MQIIVSSLAQNAGTGGSLLFRRAPVVVSGGVDGVVGANIVGGDDVNSVQSNEHYLYVGAIADDARFSAPSSPRTFSTFSVDADGGE